MKKRNGLSFSMPKVILLLGCVFLAGCSGDSSSESSAIQDDQATVSSISSPDTDNNGIWDDLDKVILTFDFTNSEEIVAIEKAVKASQDMILFGAGESQKSIQEVGNELSSGSRCMVEAFGEDSFNIRKRLQFMLYSTEERSQGQREFDKASVGVVFQDAGGSCE